MVMHAPVSSQVAELAGQAMETVHVEQVSLEQAVLAVSKGDTSLGSQVAQALDRLLSLSPEFATLLN